MASLPPPQARQTIDLLINNLVNIKDTTGQFLLHLQDGRIIDTKSWAGWEWTHGIGLYGIWKYYEMTGDAKLLGIIEDWFAARFAEGGTTKNINTMAVFLTLAYVYEKTGNNHQQLWDDTLMMTVMPLAKIGKLLNRPAYIAEAKRQFLVHIKYLFDTKTGLWFHGWTFEDGGHNFANARWARGNSWVTIAIPEIIELLDLEPEDPLRIHLIDTLEAQCEALQRFQTDAGDWRTLLDHEDSYVESSATAGFAYGILKAVRKRYIRADYKAVADKAIAAVVKAVDEKGELLNTSFGTAMGDTLDFYKQIPLTAMPYGQAMAIMALGEYLRELSTYQAEKKKTPNTKAKMLYTHATIVTVDPSRRIINDGAICVRDDIIADIGKTAELKGKYPDDEEYDLSGRIVIPGLISTHMHTAQTLLRGAADDLELVSWLCERIWVLQGNFTAGDGYAAARLSIGEMLKTGTTCFLESMFADRYGFDGLCRAVEESGIRGCLGKIVMDIAKYAKDDAWAMHPGLVEDRETSLLGTLKMWDKWNGKANDRIRVWFGARTPGGVSDALYQEMTRISREKGIPITMHCAEVKADRDFFASVGHTPMTYCDSVGLLSPSTVLVHMVHLDDNDIRVLAGSGTHVAHCPTSNAKLASGICRVPDLQEAGVNIGLGTDGAPCNNTCDLLQEMKLAAIIHKSISYDPTAVPAESVLEMATINGAKALGLDDRIGSLEVGKKADFVAIDMRGIHSQPWFNPVSAVIYTATGRDVDVVVVDGKVLVAGGKLLTMDEEEIVREAQQRSREVVERAGLLQKVQPRWPVE
ncbi:putative guanine deaminase [Aspergillus rambellii]|uniref:Putative guanine deaminase n=1 Tax=Aspergillus rambellii TaxID=308745 RepID=A0A0F8UPD9_9EURO|nr:putative guanine deaminase [Aspergillus rambellii]